MLQVCSESDNTSSENVTPGHVVTSGTTSDEGLKVTARHPLIARICEQCGGSFEVALYQVVRRGRGRFCSPGCGARFNMLRRNALRPPVGPDNPGWKGGISKNNSHYTRLFEARHPEKAAAHEAVAKAIRKGLLVRPSGCQDCPWIGKPESHHDDYTKPLSVRWLCRGCHIRADRARRLRERKRAA